MCVCGVCVFWGLDVSYFTACLTASIWSWDSVTATFTPLSPYTQAHIHNHKYMHSQWQLCHSVTDLPHPPAANRPKDREVEGLRIRQMLGLRMWLEARQETDTGMDKTPKGWWLDGWMSQGRRRSKGKTRGRGGLTDEKMKENNTEKRILSEEKYLSIKEALVKLRLESRL